MHILRYTCVQCGIVTRVEQGQSYCACACACNAACEMVDERDEVEVIVIITPETP